MHSSSWRVQHQICCSGCCHVVDASLHQTEQRALLPRSRKLLCCVCCIQSLPLLQSGHILSQQGHSIDSCLLVPCFHWLSSACSRNQVSANLKQLCFMCVLASFLTQTTPPLACIATQILSSFVSHVPACCMYMCLPATYICTNMFHTCSPIPVTLGGKSLRKNQGCSRH